MFSNAAALHWEIARRDLRSAIRSLVKSPGFAITALLLITIGIGANAAIFTLADFVLVRPLPFPEPQRLVKVWEKHQGYSEMELSPANYRDFKAASTSFASLAAYNDMAMNLVGQGEPQRVEGAWVTGNLFTTLGRRALLGRVFNDRDDEVGAPATVVLSYSLWQTDFGGDAGVLGKSVILDDKAYTVIGVMPPDFNFPSREALFWKTFQFDEDSYKERDNNYLIGIGRLKPGVTLAKARSELTLVADRVRQQYPKENEGVGATVTELRDSFSAQSRLLLMALCGAALCVLVITCANLANLLLARSLARQKEFSIRVSLGANRRNLLRQTPYRKRAPRIGGRRRRDRGGGGGAASAVAAGAARAADPGSASAGCADAAAGAGSDGDYGDGVRCRSGNTSVQECGLRRACARACGREAPGITGRRSALVVAEVVVSVVLLIMSGLLIRALWKVQAIDPGFRTDGVLTLRTALPLPKYEKTMVRGEFYDKVLSEVRGCRV